MQLGGEGRGGGEGTSSTTSSSSRSSSTSSSGSSRNGNNSMWGQAKVVVREGGGLRGLYRGFPVLLLKLLPTTVVSYRVSAQVAEWLEENG